MSDSLGSVRAFLYGLYLRFTSFGTRVGWWKVILGAAIIIVALIILRGKLFSHADIAAQESNIPSVTVRSVSDLASGASSLSTVGVVNAKSEATVRAETSGTVVGVYHTLGDQVKAGSVIVELENASQRAAVLQAQGAVDAANVSVQKMGGSSNLLQAALDAANSGSINALLGAYASVDSAIRGTADTMFSNPDSFTPQFSIPAPNTQLIVDVQNQRIALRNVLARQSERSKNLNIHDDLEKELDATEAEVRTSRGFLDQILTALTSAQPNQTVTAAVISTDTTAATAARASLTASLSAISYARQVLITAKQNLAQGVVSGQSQDVAAAQATLKQAQGALAAAKANLEKAIIRAPISGTINSLSLKQGDFVQQFSPVVTLANNGALEIVTYVTDQDVETLSVGNTVTLEDGNTGIITHIAPAVDPATKKIEVRIGVAAGSTLLNGQSVIINFPHSTAPAASKPKTPQKITIPITALKVGAQNVTVFTVSSSTLVAHSVVLGELLGNRVVVTQGLTPDTLIVTDARGLHEGEIVTVH